MSSYKSLLDLMDSHREKCIKRGIFSEERKIKVQPHQVALITVKEEPVKPTKPPLKKEILKRRIYTFDDKLKALTLLDEGKTYMEVAEIMGIHQSNIRYWDQGNDRADGRCWSVREKKKRAKYGSLTK